MAQETDLQKLNDQIVGSRITGIEVSPGEINTLVIVLEGTNGERCTLNIQADYLINASAGMVRINSKLNARTTPWRK